MNVVRALCVFVFLVVLATPSAMAEDKPLAIATRHVRATDGVDIVCRVAGKSDTALLFLHGWCGDHEYWNHQVPVFAATHTVVTVDQAGHGESGKNRENWTVDGLGADAEAVVKSLGLKRVIIVGHSMGAPAGLCAARRLPGTVVAVIGVDTLQNAEMQMPEAQAKQFADNFEKNFKGTLAGMMTGIVGTHTDPKIRQWLQSRAEAQDAAMAVALMRDFGNLDTKRLLREAKVPVRCINSAGGFQFFRKTAEDVNKKYADFKAVLIDDVGHYPMVEKPKEFNEKLVEVLREFSAK